MSKELIRLQSASGFEVVGDYFARGHSQAAVVYVHGLGSHRRGEKARALAAASRESGWAFAAIDFHGHGQSAGSLRDLRCTRLQQDLDALWAYLQNQGITRLYMVGSSMGGWAASWFAKRLGKAIVPALAVFAPAFRFPSTRLTTLTPAEVDAWKMRGTHTWQTPWMTMELEWGLMTDAANYPLADLVKNWDTPLKIYHGTNDDVVPYEDSLSVFQSLSRGPWSIELLADGDHRLTDQKTLLVRQIMEWFGQRATV